MYCIQVTVVIMHFSNCVPIILYNSHRMNGPESALTHLSKIWCLWYDR